MTQHIIDTDELEKLTPEKWFNRKLAETRQSNDKDLHSALVKNAGFYSYGYEQAIIDLRALIANSPQADDMALVPLEPTEEMINQGAQRLVSWDEGCEWPDSWSPLAISAAKNEAERVWRSMWLSAYKPQADDVGKDAERYRWLRDNNATVIEVQEEKRGYRSTVPDARRERWFEHSGWNVSTLPMTLEFKTMDEAVDFAIDKARE